MADLGEEDVQFSASYDPVSGETVRYRLRTAKAKDRPCELHNYHAPQPSRTQGHHRYPVYLQNRVYGRIQNSDLMWLCGTCHDNVHEWLSWLLGEARKPDPEPGILAKREAQYTYRWYTSATSGR